MQLESFNKVYLVGIGGIGMSALARWFFTAGYQVAGYDRTPSEITEKLMDLGINISFDESVEAIPQSFIVDKEHTLIIYTPAVPAAHQGLNYFKTENFKLIKRSAALGLLVQNKRGIAVSGTHGKTSVSTLVTCIMNETKESCSAFLGGIARNLDSNVLINPHSDWVVVEADEFDRSFLTLFPEIAVITAIDADHLDIYKDKEDILRAFEQFIGQVKPNGKVVIKLGVEFNQKVNSQVRFYRYSLLDQTDFYASNLRLIDGLYHFDFNHPHGIIRDLELGIPGLYNLENAVAATAVTWLAGVDKEIIVKALKSFRGVKRRFDFQVRTPQLVYIDDYAHHPEEIKACIRSARHLFPGKRITGIFQPHLYSRTRDFASEFAQSLDLFDQVILTPIYPAREEPIEGVNSELILNLMKNVKKSVCSFSELVNRINTLETDVLITMGAGNIDKLVIPIKEKLVNRLANPLK